MNKFCVVWMIILAVLLIGCSDQTPAIEKKDTPGIQDESVTIVEQPTEEEDTDEVETMIEFTLPSEQVVINLEQIPILKNYLAQVKSRTQAINNMKLTKLETTSSDSLYMLEFSCQEETCSYLLLDTDHGNSFLLADLASFSNVKTSPDQSKLLFQFIRNIKEQEWNKHKLFVLDIDNWEQILLNTQSSIAINTFSWPIQDFNWKDDETISATIPAIEELTPETMRTWLESEQTTREITLSLRTE